jgi:hypothetical protein
MFFVYLTIVVFAKNSSADCVFFSVATHLSLSGSHVYSLDGLSNAQITMGVA